MLRSLLSGVLVALVLGIAAPVRAQQTTTYAPTDAIFPNPERGFYTHRSVQAEGQPLSLADLKYLRDDADVTLILRLYYLKTFRDRPLSPKQLDLIRTDFDVLRQAGSKAILRFAYSGNQSEPDAPLDVILGHLDQLEPLLRENGDVIAAVEAGLIGAWGEWYYSSNGLNNTADRRTVTEKWLSVLPETRMVQVRTPGYKRAIFGRTTPLAPEEGYDGSNYARTGHHNDCFLASSTDYGTYQNITSDKAYLESDTRFTAMGGETCNPNPPRSECATALEELERFHWSYLNRDYHGGVLGSWRLGGCMDEVKRRLGYRFRLVDGTIASTVRPGGVFGMVLRIANDGFAAPYNPRRVEIVLRERETGARFVTSLDADPRRWAAGDTVTVDASVGVPASLPEGVYDVLLNLPAPERSLYERPEYAVRVANEAVWEPETGYNRLLVETVVSGGAAGEAYAGDRWFQPYERHVGAEPELPRGDGSVSPGYPNPFEQHMSVRVTVPVQQPVRVRVFDVLGRQVASLYEGTVHPGNDRVFTFDAGGLPGGLYFVRVEGTTFSATRRVLRTP